MTINKFLSKDVKIKKIDITDVDSDQNSFRNTPVFKFNKVLLNIREESSHSKLLVDQMKVVNDLKNELTHLASSLGISENKFDIDTSGDPLVIQKNGSQHDILPTHFEKGAYFSSPHFDHEFNMKADELPRIKIGKYTRFGIGASVNAGNNIIIGNCVWLAPGSVLLRQEHSAYGQPSIGARTISMTRQPSIVVSETLILREMANCFLLIGITKEVVKGLFLIIKIWYFMMEMIIVEVMS